MKWPRVGVLFAALAVSFPLFYNNLARPVSDSLAAPSYITTQPDEVFVLGIANYILEDGYTGIRCRRGHTGSCYGGTQAYLDALTLRAAPQGWLKEIENLRGPSYPWLYLVRYPRMLQVLRWSRVFYAVALILATGALGYWYSRDWLLGIFFALAMGSSAIFTTAWQGAKNDYATTLWQLAFLHCLFALFSGAATKEGVNSRRFHLAFIVGFVGSFVRPILLPLTLMLAPVYAIIALATSKRLKSVVRDLVICAGTSVFLFCVLHPNIFASSSEAGWLLPFIGFIKHRLTVQDVVRELWLASQAAWVAVFAAVALWVYVKEQGIRKAVISSGFFWGCAVFLFVSNVKSATSRLYYYLPVFTLLLMLLAWFWPRRRPVFAQKLCLAFGLAVTALNLATSGSPWRGWAALSLPKALPKTPLEVLFELPESRSTTWLVDNSLRPPIHENLIPAEQIVFFDSLKEAPLETLLEASKRSAGPPERVLAACWNDESPALSALGSDSPNSRAWSKLLSSYCTDRESDLVSALSPFLHGFRATHFAVVPYAELLAAARHLGPPHHVGARLHPSLFRNSEVGMDNYDMPLVLDRSVRLSANFVFPEGLKKVSVPVASTCKDPDSSIELAVNSSTSRWSTGKVALDVSRPLCDDYPYFCRYDWFRRWSERRFPPQKTVELEVAVRPGSAARIEVLTNQNHCRLVLQELPLVSLKAIQ